MKCVYCLSKLTNQKITLDHIFPRSWRTKSDIGTYKGLTVPACLQCNQEFEKIEEKLLPRLLLCIDDTNEFTLDLRLSGFKKRFSLLATDKQSYNRKTALYDEIYSDMQKFEDIFDKEIIHNPYGGDRSTKVIRLPSKYLNQIAKKFACSLEYYLRENYLGHNRGIEFWLYGIQNSTKKDEKTLQIDQFLEKKGEKMNQGRSFVVSWISNKQFTDQVFYRIEIWQSYQFYLFISNKSKNDPLIQQIPLVSNLKNKLF